MITYQTQTVTKVAGADLTNAEGCFVTLSSGNVVLTTASTTALKTYGVLHTTAAAGEKVTVALPGHAGLVQVATTNATADGDYLVLAASGKVKSATTGVAVAVAVEDAAANTLVTARLINPTTLS